MANASKPGDDREIRDHAHVEMQHAEQQHGDQRPDEGAQMVAEPLEPEGLAAVLLGDGPGDEGPAGRRARAGPNPVEKPGA